MESITACQFMKTPLLLLMPFAFLGALGPTAEKPHWHADWPTAQRIAQKSNRPVFAVFVCKH